MSKVILINSEVGMFPAADKSILIVGSNRSMPIRAKEIGIAAMMSNTQKYLVVVDGTRENVPVVWGKYKSCEDPKPKLIILTNDLGCQIEGAEVVKIEKK